MRRSTRLACASIVNCIEDEQANEDSAPQQGTQSSRSSVKSNKTGNKRKSEPQSKESNTTPPKRMRSMRGLLQAVSTMPLDVLVEVSFMNALLADLHCRYL